MMEKIQITLSRVYEYDLENLGFSGNNLNNVVEIAKQQALNDFADEMVYFESKPDDFVSVNWKIMEVR